MGRITMFVKCFTKFKIHELTLFAITNWILNSPNWNLTSVRHGMFGQERLQSHGTSKIDYASNGFCHSVLTNKQSWQWQFDSGYEHAMPKYYRIRNIETQKYVTKHLECRKLRQKVINCDNTCLTLSTSKHTHSHSLTEIQGRNHRIL